MRIGVVVKFLGFLLLVISAWMLAPLIYTAINGGDDILSFVETLTVSGSVSLLFILVSRRVKMSEMGMREAMASVTLSWVAASAVSGLPYWFHGSAPMYADAFFEAMSGYTTTGSTILTDIDSAPGGLILWRGLTHWLGGMGIIVLTLTLMPLIGVGGFQMYRAEVPGMVHEKLTPRVQGTAVILWLIYMALTVVLTALLMIGGMDFLDAVTHSMGTISTGGFSSKSASLAFYDSAYFDWVITFFMFLSGANFVLHFHAIKRRSLRCFFEDPEFSFYSVLIISIGLAVSSGLYLSGTYSTLSDSLRFGFFQVVSLVTTTGFISADYDLWPYFIKSMLFICLFMGGCAGSTSGSIKQVRLLVMSSHIARHISRILSPRSIAPLRIGARSLDSGVVSSCFAFLGLYAVVLAAGAFVISLFEPDLFTAISGAATTLGNVGPGFGVIGPTMNFAGQATGAKWTYSFLMLCGRLEFFTVLILFTRAFWRGGAAL
ncbi:MAG: TrkH family potassium uptake protein [Synergistaceae bacterium]|nr:TrkH family potassium uptake protein [Synergistaceae bacterium]